MHRAYRGAGYSDFPLQNTQQAKWFENHGWWTTDKNAGQVGDVIYWGKGGELKNVPYNNHAAMIRAVETTAEGIVKYKIMAAGGKGTTDYPNMDFKTMDELSKTWADGKEFVGIGSVQPVVETAPVAETAQREPNIFISILQALLGGNETITGPEQQ